MILPAGCRQNTRFAPQYQAEIHSFCLDEQAWILVGGCVDHCLNAMTTCRTAGLGTPPDQVPRAELGQAQTGFTAGPSGFLLTRKGLMPETEQTMLNFRQAAPPIFSTFTMHDGQATLESIRSRYSSQIDGTAASLTRHLGGDTDGQASITAGNHP